MIGESRTLAMMPSALSGSRHIALDVMPNAMNDTAKIEIRQRIALYINRPR